MPCAPQSMVSPVARSHPNLAIRRYPAAALAPKQGVGRRLAAFILPPFVMGVLLVLAYWWARSGLEPHRQFLMPTAEGLWTQAFSRPEIQRQLVEAAITTLSIALAGLAISIPVGIGLAVVMFRFQVMEKAVFPYLVALQSIPVLAVIPLLQSALGFGFLPKVLIVALFTFFSIPTTLLLGLKSIDRAVLDLFRLQGARWPTMLRKAGFPSAAPTLFAGLRISAGLAVVGAIVSELFFLSGPGGLGQMLINAKIDFKYEQMYAALLASSMLSLGVYLLFSWLGNRLFSEWHESGRK